MEPSTPITTRSKARKRSANEVTDINIDIQEVISSVPGAAKYFRPVAPPAKKSKTSETRTRASKPAAKRGKKKSTSAPAATPRQRADNSDLTAGPSPPETVEIDSSDSDSDIINGLYTLGEKPTTYRFKQENPSTSRKKAARKAPELEFEPTPEPEDIRDCTVYVYVSKPTAAPTSKVKAPPPVVAERGPFFFPLNSTFTNFCDRLAVAVGCRTAALNLPMTKWKYMKPTKDHLKALGTQDGYKAMRLSMQERSKDLIIEVHMAPPLLLAADLPYETDDYKPPDSFEELDAPAASSVRQQMATLDASAAPVMEQLRERYPIGNHPSFPTKRIVTSTTNPDRHWELTDIRIRVWAAHILQDKATLDEYPKSAHFSEEQRLRAPHTPAPVPLAPPIAPPQLPIPAAVPAPAVPAATATNATDLLLLLLAQQMTANNKPVVPTADPLPLAAPTLPSTPAPGHSSLPSSPAVTLSRSVSLAEFCTCYSISPVDETKLAALDFVPGDRNIKKLDKSDWGDVGFKRLGWLRILDAHRRFLNDIRNGSFV
ncbi:hypothetical protein B0H11DRAFT_2275141 [Mycena galericulata]|nr:hypothetical protein B0H11DRAFT_2275141 [Mycena galericulata]